MGAALFGRTEAARLLLKAGADVNKRNADGYTAMVAAESSGYIEIVTLLENYQKEE